MCHAQLVLPLQLHIVLNIPGWRHGELRGAQDEKTTPVWTQTCSNIKLLSRMTEKFCWISKLPGDRKQGHGSVLLFLHAENENKEFSAEWGLLLFAHFPGTPMGTELSAIYFVPSILCHWLCRAHTTRTNPPRATTCEQQQIPAMNRTQAPSQPEFYRDREKTQLHNSACKSVKYSSMKGCK